MTSLSTVRHCSKPRFIALVLLLAALRSVSAESGGAAFTNALEQFQAGFYARSETAFSNFVVRFPQSPQAPSALLFQARSALNDNRPAVAAGLLARNATNAAALADQFQYWLGQAQLRAEQPAAAVLTFSNLNHTFTNSALRLETALAQAEAHFALQQWLQVAATIENPSGPFHIEAVKRGTNDPIVARGYLMVARAWLKQREFTRAEQALSRVSEGASDPRLRWERQFFLCRSQQGLGRLDQALVGSTNLLVFAGSDPHFRAASVALQGELLRLIGRLPESVAAYEGNIKDTAPVERRREAFLRIIELTLEQGQLTNAILRLERFVTDNPADAATDVAWLAVGELRLKQHQVSTNSASGGTNMLDLAIAALNRFIAEFPKSPYKGRAHLDRGWAFLEQGKYSDSAAAFQLAARELEPSEDQAVAYFKLGDIQFRTGDLTNAIASYRHVANGYEAFPRVQRQLVDRALYQMLQTANAAGNASVASEAIARLEEEYPKSEYVESSLLLFGQTMNELADTAAAKKVFQAFQERFPNSPRLPEAKLALARTFEREGDYASAAQQYSDWVAKFSTNSNLPYAELSRAIAIAKSKGEATALPLFTNYVTRFMTNPFAARAQYWIGDFYYGRGMVSNSYEQFAEAERNYQRVFSSIATNWPVTPLTYDAQVKAGRAAFRRQGWDDAIGWFTKLIDNTNCPVDVRIEATFAYADTYLSKPQTNQVQRFTTAKNILSLIFGYAGLDPSDSQIPRAWGRIGDFYYQLAGARDERDVEAKTQDYNLAYEHYHKAQQSSVADIATIAQATVGLGKVRRSQANLAANLEQKAGYLGEALNYYLDVVYAPADERPDAMLLHMAGRLAGELCEEQKRYRQAIEVYRRVADLIPALRPAMEKRVESAREKESLQRP